MKDKSEFIPTRRSLLSRLKNWDDHDSWKVFFDTYWRLIYNAALRSGLTDAEAQDVVQETVISVSKSLAQSAYDPKKGSFKTWLMRLTGWRIVGQLRKRRPGGKYCNQGTDADDQTDLIEKIPDEAISVLESHWDEEWESNLMETAIRRVKSKVDPKQYQIFDLYARKNWPVGKVANDLKITRARVYLAKHRVSNSLKKEIEYLRSKLIPEI
jgi:RNA polymerase sigma-70 factor (ECF subfamily)